MSSCQKWEKEINRTEPNCTMIGRMTGLKVSFAQGYTSSSVQGPKCPIRHFWHLYISNEWLILIEETMANTLCAVSHKYLLPHSQEKTTYSHFTWLECPFSVQMKAATTKPPQLCEKVNTPDHNRITPGVAESRLYVSPAYIRVLCKL